MKNGYNLTVRRKIFEFVYSKIFFTSLKDYYVDNYYSNRNHYKEYLLWIYLHTVQTNINGKKIRPFHKAFDNNIKFSEWSYDGLFVATMGLSCKTPGWYKGEPYCSIAEAFGVDIEKARVMYYSYSDESRLS